VDKNSPRECVNIEGIHHENESIQESQHVLLLIHHSSTQNRHNLIQTHLILLQKHDILIQIRYSALPIATSFLPVAMWNKWLWEEITIILTICLSLDFHHSLPTFISIISEAAISTSIHQEAIRSSTCRE
jgi:hypothetical protein